MKAARRILQQTIEIKDWPLVTAGDKEFFGYLVGIGILPSVADDGDTLVYAEFYYAEKMYRFKIPFEIVWKLQTQLLSNIEEFRQTDGAISGKLWIERTESGYEISLP